MREYFAVMLFAVLLGCTASGPIPSGTDAAGMHYRGVDGAKAVVVEFSDFQCPYCAQAQPVVERLLREYPGRIKLVYRHYPLPAHENAFAAAQAAECAADQGKFWEMHDKMYANQQALDGQGLIRLAAQVGLDWGGFEACLQGGEKRGKVEGDIAEGRMFGVRATPTFFIGRQAFEGAPYEGMKAAVEAQLDGGN